MNFLKVGGYKVFIHGSAGAKLTLNQDFKHGKED
jgi:hypothetical protein